MPRPLRIGLTGGIASGKSTVAQRFVELGVPVIDADESSRFVVTPGGAGLAAVAARFGAGVLTATGELDRRALRDRVFANPKERLALEAILHPLIQADMRHRAEAVTAPYVVMAIPLLVEGGHARDRVDRILVVDVAEATQLERLMSRDGSSLAQARAIIEAQAGRECRIKAADDLLINAGSLSELRQDVDDLHQRYLALAAAFVDAPGRIT
jgi:dephospho-CoA kinase